MADRLPDPVQDGNRRREVAGRTGRQLRLVSRVGTFCKVRLILYAVKTATAFIPRNLFQPIVALYYNLRSLFYSGDNVKCNCCGNGFRRFIKWEGNNWVCPRCNAFERHRLLWLYFEAKTNLFSESARVLHVGPEYGLQKALKSKPNIEYVSIDLSSPLAMLKMDITDLHFEDDGFDVVICNHVLEHVPDDQRAMRELLRVLKPGEGWAVIQSPIEQDLEVTYEDFRIVSPEGRHKAFGRYDHVRLYGLDYYDRLRKAGFVVDAVDYAAELDDDTIERYSLRKAKGRLPDEICLAFKR